MSLQSIFCYQNGGSEILTPTRNPIADWVFRGDGKATELVSGFDLLVKIENNTVKHCDIWLPGGAYVSFPDAAYSDSDHAFSAADADAVDEAISNCGRIEDGSYEATAFGKGIRGNPLRMPYAALYYYAYAPAVIEEDVPLGFDELGSFLQNLKSRVANGVPREWGDTPAAQRGIIRASGICWHHPDGRMAKIRLSDFTEYYAKENGKR